MLSARWLSLLTLVELLKAAIFIAAGLEQPWGDSAGYWALAGDAAAGDVWLMTSAQCSRTPGYPWFLAVCRWLFGSSALLAAVVLQHLAVAATSLLVMWLTWQLTRRRDLALFAWGVCALSTARPLYANWVLTESLATLLLTAAVAVLCAASRKPGEPLMPLTVGQASSRSQRLLQWVSMPGGLGWSALLLGLGILVRPALVAALPVWCLVAWWCWQNGSGGWRRAGSVAAAALVFVVLLAPWCGRNRTLCGRWSLTVFTGRELWKTAFDPWPGATLPIPMDGAAVLVHQRLEGTPCDLRHNWSVSGALSRSGLPEHEVDELMETVARQAIRRDPARFIGCTLARMLTFWYVWEWPTELTDSASPEAFADQRWPRWRGWPETLSRWLTWTPERRRPVMVAWTVLTWIGVVGLCWWPATRRTGLIMGGVLLSTTMLTAALEVPLYRYRLILEPLMIVATVSGLWAGSCASSGLGQRR